jgi:hypothetical protein
MVLLSYRVVPGLGRPLPASFEAFILRGGGLVDDSACTWSLMLLLLLLLMLLGIR